LNLESLAGLGYNAGENRRKEGRKKWRGSGERLKKQKKEEIIGGWPPAPNVRRVRSRRPMRKDDGKKGEVSRITGRKSERLPER